MADNYKPLVGYSGARLFIATTPARSKYVRKIAAGSEFNARLNLQMRRQHCFERLTDRPFRVPAVLNEGMQGGLFYFDMEFVDAVDGAYFLAIADFQRIKSFRGHLLETFRFLAQSEPFESSHAPCVESLAAKVFNVASREPRLSETASFRILRGLDQLRQQDTLHLQKGTLYHGDFTLENILVTRDAQIVLLDFLDSPLPHYWQDISKIHLDLESHWYARRYRRISEWVVCYLREELMALAARQNPLYPQFHHLLLAINLVRILPYARNPTDQEFLLHNIEFQASQIQH